MTFKEKCTTVSKDITNRWNELYDQHEGLGRRDGLLPDDWGVNLRLKQERIDEIIELLSGVDDIKISINPYSGDYATDIVFSVMKNGELGQVVFEGAF